MTGCGKRFEEGDPFGAYICGRNGQVCACCRRKAKAFRPPPPISQEARDARKPLPVDALLAATEDTAPTPCGRLISSKPLLSPEAVASLAKWRGTDEDARDFVAYMLGFQSLAPNKTQACRDARDLLAALAKE